MRVSMMLLTLASLCAGCDVSKEVDMPEGANAANAAAALPRAAPVPDEPRPAAETADAAPVQPVQAGCSRDELQRVQIATQRAAQQMMAGGNPFEIAQRTADATGHISPSCRAELDRRFPQRGGLPPSAPADYHRDGGGVVIPGVGGCGATGCTVR